MNTEKIELSVTQQRVFDYIVDFGSITTLQSITDLGETRLLARIFELQEKGVNISSSWKDVKNRYGEKRRIKSYFIA
ncbi:MAG: helix-turn-helix domain-containing protein [Treponema sp.]